MKTLYFDLSCGASGDMILSALFDLGVPLDQTVDLLRSVAPVRFELGLETIQRNGIACKRCCIVVPHEHEHRSLSVIERMIQGSSIPIRSKDTAVRIFRRLAQAEAKVHGTDVEKIHFHEVGALDSILDIVGASIGFELLGIEAFFAGTLVEGTGTVKAAHGVLPVPAPATAELIKGFPIRIIDTGTELLTPTGAAIITTLAQPGLPPGFAMDQAGYGAGQKEIALCPNLIRLWLGDTQSASGQDRVVVLETNIDDSSPELLSYAMEQLFEAGALDVFFTAITMKKSRPAILLQAIAPVSAKESLLAILFRETSTIGVRFQEMERRKVERTVVEIESPWGKLKAKRLGDPNQARIAPEYEECRRVAREKNMPLQQIYSWVLSQNTRS